MQQCVASISKRKFQTLIMKTKKIALIAVLASALLAFNPLAWAQTADDQNADTENTNEEDAAELERIVIVATRTPRPQFSTPAATTVISRDEIEIAQPYAFQDLLETETSVTVQGGPRRIAEEPAIRGFADEQVVIRENGARQNFNRAHGGRFFTDPDLVRTVEIVRGASSAIYGSGALGGVIALESLTGRDLTGGQDGFGGRLRGAYMDNGDEFSLFTTLYGQVGGFDLIGSYVSRDFGEDLQDGDGVDIFSTQDDIESGQVIVGFEPSEFQRIEFGYSEFANEGINPTNANAVATPTNIVDRDTERSNYRLRYEYNNPDNKLLNLSVVAYRNEVETDEFRFDDLRIDTTDFETSGFEVVNTSRFSVGQENDLVLTYGIETFTDEQSGTRSEIDMFGQRVTGPRTQFPAAEVEYRAAFVQAEIPLGSMFTLIPGVRYDEFDYDADDFDDRDDDQVSPKIALGFQPADWVYLWADYSEAFRAPSLTELFVDGVHFEAELGPGQIVVNEFVPTPDLEAEEVEQYQFGARFRQDNIFDSETDFSLDLVYFDSTIDNFIDQRVIFISGPPTFNPFTQTLVFPGLTINGNANAEIDGFEAAVSLENRRGYARLSYTALDSNNRDTGESLFSVQPDQAALSVGAYALDRQLTLGAQLIASSARNDLPADAQPTPGWGKTDVFVRYEPNRGFLNGFDFRLTVDNLFDKDYRVHPNGIDQPGRSVRLSVGYEFGPW